MIKKIILGSLFLFSLQIFAQGGTASPYSYYGIGEVKFRGTIENRSMGGIGVLNDSIHINLQNPAALSSLKLTTFSVAGTFSPEKLKTSSDTQKAQRTTFDYFAVAFPAGKMAFNLGLMPYSSVGYKITKNANGGDYSYDGTGNINRFFIGAGYQLTPKLSVGAEINYDFGKIEKNVGFLATDSQYGTIEKNSSELSGFGFKGGVIYKTKISKLDFVNSLTYQSLLKLNSDSVLREGTFSPTSGAVIYNEALQQNNSDKLKLPSKLTFGSGIGSEKKWFVGFESTFLSKGDLDLNKSDESTYEASSKMTIGGYYIPKYNSFSSYFDRVTYRAGLRYENTGLVIKNESIKDKAVTFGFGLPLGGSLSNINLGLEFGKRGTTNTGLVQENYMNFSVGLSFNDRWFVKRKYD